MSHRANMRKRADRVVDAAVVDLMSSPDVELKNEIADRRLIDNALAQADWVSFNETSSIFDTRRDERRARRWVRVAVYCAAVLLVGLFSVVFAGITRTEAPSDVPQGPTVSVPVAGQQKMETRPTAWEQAAQEPYRGNSESKRDAKKVIAKRDHRTVLELSSTIAVMAEPDSEISMGPVDENRMVLNLISGQVLVSVNPKRTGPVLVVRTAEGEIEVKGTVFRVTASLGQSSVEVLRGVVKVTNQKKDRTAVSAGFGASIKEVQTAELGSSEIETLDQVAKALETRGPGVAVVDLSEFSVPEPMLEAGDPPDFGPDKTKVTERSRVKPVKPRLNELLEEARTAKREKAWEQAVSAYLLAGQLYGTSPMGACAYVTAGTIQLERLNSPSASLKSFEKYIEQGDETLRQEALLGKARALGQMGKSREELQTLTMFIQAFPDSFHARRVQARMDALQTSGADGVK